MSRLSWCLAVAGACARERMCGVFGLMPRSWAAKEPSWYQRPDSFEEKPEDVAFFAEVECCEPTAGAGAEADALVIGGNFSSSLAFRDRFSLSFVR